MAIFVTLPSCQGLFSCYSTPMLASLLFCIPFPGFCGTGCLQLPPKHSPLLSQLFSVTSLCKFDSHGESSNPLDKLRARALPDTRTVLVYGLVCKRWYCEAETESSLSRLGRQVAEL